MKRFLAIAFSLLLLGGVCVGAVSQPKVMVGTYSMTSTYFKPDGCDHNVGGGYSVLSNAQGNDRVGLEFMTEADFKLTENQYITINTGVQSTASGATSFGIATGLNEWTPTANGYRGKVFNVHFYTFTPEPSIINQLAAGTLSKDKGETKIGHEVKIGDKIYNMGMRATLLGSDIETESEMDASATEKGFGQNLGYENGVPMAENGMYFEGFEESDSTTVIS